MSGYALRQVRVFAPASVSNLGPGFDLLGMAVSGPGDTVIARLGTRPGVRISRVQCANGNLPVEASRNTAGLAATATLRKIGLDLPIELEVEKGMPVGSGLGSSAASAVAAAMAVNLLVGAPLRKAELVEPCVEAEAAVSGRHADNVAPSLLGGLVLVRSVAPLELLRLPVPPGLHVAVVTPAFELQTRLAREALPETVPLQAHVRNSASLATLIAACYSGDLALLGRAVVDEIVTPVRARLIPGCQEVIEAALASGALGSSISGAGPSVFALCYSDRTAAAVAAAMQRAFRDAAGLVSSQLVSVADSPGARQL